MNHKQLSDLFKSSLKDTDESINVNQFESASTARIQEAEKLSNHNLHSSTQKVMFELEKWNQSISSEITDSLDSKDSFFVNLFSDWLKPALAACFVFGFVLVINSDLNQSQAPVHSSDKIMFSSSFDKKNTPIKDVINKVQFENNKDVIHTTNFG